MDTSVPLSEDLLIYSGQLICILSALYLAKLGQIKIAAIFLLGFILQFQAGYVVSIIETDTELQGKCWANVGSYYKCLPLVHRVSIHAGQFGIVLLGVGVFLTARQFNKHGA